jgi:hypothetical protein
MNFMNECECELNLEYSGFIKFIMNEFRKKFIHIHECPSLVAQS